LHGTGKVSCSGFSVTTGHENTHAAAAAIGVAYGFQSDGTRRALSNQYCQPWARTQEIFFLGIPPIEAAKMSVKIQSLLGYSIHPPFMGQVTASHPQKSLREGFVPPAFRTADEL